MAIANIPVTADDPSFRQVTDLGGVDFELVFDWNDRASHWNLSVYTADGEAVALGLVLVPGIRLMRRVKGTIRPAGEIICTGESSVVGRDELGVTAEVLYVDGDDLEALE